MNLRVILHAQHYTVYTEITNHNKKNNIFCSIWKPLQEKSPALLLYFLTSLFIQSLAFVLLFCWSHWRRFHFAWLSFSAFQLNDSPVSWGMSLLRVNGIQQLLCCLSEQFWRVFFLSDEPLDQTLTVFFCLLASFPGIVFKMRQNSVDWQMLYFSCLAEIRFVLHDTFLCMLFLHVLNFGPGNA